MITKQRVNLCSVGRSVVYESVLHRLCVHVCVVCMHVVCVRSYACMHTHAYHTYNSYVKSMLVISVYYRTDCVSTVHIHGERGLVCASEWSVQWLCTCDWRVLFITFPLLSTWKTTRAWHRGFSEAVYIIIQLCYFITSCIPMFLSRRLNKKRSAR